MNCPHCQHAMHTITYESIEIDVCQSCEGIWLDDKEIVPILRATEEQFSLDDKVQAHTRTGEDHRATDHKINCPKCSVALDTLPYAYNSGVIVDRCPNDHGLWFDKGEIEKVQILLQEDEKYEKTHIQFNDKKLCPIDNTPLVEMDYETEILDKCPTCEGIWCDHSELQAVIESHDTEFTQEDFKNIVADVENTKTVSSIDIEPGYNCAVCNEEMQRLNFSYNSGIIIDHCQHKHGVWLDKDELERIQAFSERWNQKVDEDSQVFAKRLEQVAAAAVAEWETSMKDAWEKGKKLSWLARKIEKLAG